MAEPVSPHLIPALRPGCYLVTGGAGFIGSHLVDALLAEGCTVRVLDDLSTGRHRHDHPRCVFIRGDVADRACVLSAMEGVAGCFHLAAIASVVRGNEDWLGSHRANQTGSITVLDCARASARVPVVYASSAATYGDAGDAAIAESHRSAPTTAYGADKLGSENHAKVGWHVHGVATFGLRFFNVYGPRQDPSSPYSGVISLFSRMIAQGEPVPIHGDGGQTRDFVYVGDVVAHLLASMRHVQHRPGAYVANVCTGRATTVRALAELLARAHDRACALVPGPPRPGDIRHSRGDPAAAVALLGLRARTELRAGLDLARDSDETPQQAALREAFEEAALDPALVLPRAIHVERLAADPPGWSYTTVLADAASPLATTPNAESQELRWVPEPAVPGTPATSVAATDLAAPGRPGADPGRGHGECPRLGAGRLVAGSCGGDRPAAGRPCRRTAPDGRTAGRRLRLDPVGHRRRRGSCARHP